LFDLFLNEHAQLVVRCLFAGPVTHAAPRKKIGTIAHIKAVFFIPQDKY